MVLKLFSSLSIITVLWSCSTSDDVVVDKEPPTVDILLPERNTIYKPGDTIFINAIFSDNQSLRKGYVHIHDQFLPDGADTVFVCEFPLKSQSFELDTFWVVNDPLDKSYTIYVEGNDEAENFAQQLRYFHQFH